MSSNSGLRQLGHLGEGQLWSRISYSFAGRLAAVLFFFYGFLVIFTSPLTLPAGTDRSLVLAIGIFTVITGAVSWYLPWERWSRNATLVLPIIAFMVISLLDVASGDVHAQYSSLFLVVFAWLGLCHRRGMSTLLLPIAALSYVYSLVMVSHYPLTSVLGLASYLVPSWWVLGETIAWVSSRLIETEQSLKSSEESFRHLFADNPQPMWIYHADTFRFLEVNQATLDHYGFSRSEFLTMTLDEICLPADEQRLEREGATPADKKGRSSSRTITRSKEVLETETATHLVSFDGKPAVFAAINDVTAQNHLEDELRYQATHDSLTGLANRNALVRILDKKIGSIAGSDGSLLFLVLVDLDRFKDINYGLGYVFGDQVLVECAKRLTLELPSNYSVARLGGDEFAVLVSSETPIKIDGVAKGIVEIIGREMQIGDVVLRIDTSMGVVELPKFGVEATEALRNVDIAMHRAKREKNDWDIFNSDDEQDRLSQLTLGTDLRQAIEDGSLAVAYQQEIDLKTGEMHAAEALVRWDHPSRGAVSPEIFIPIAEQIGIIGPLTTWVLDEALKLCKFLQTKGTFIAVALNVSSQLLIDPSFVNMIEEALGRVGVSSNFLVCEITESALIEKLSDSLVNLERLRSLGVRTSLDDFGTGYSSLAYLRDLPIDELKIDRSFVTDLVSDEGLRKIVRGIIEVSHALSIKVVAEGVEDDETAGILIRMGCDIAQGYKYSRPLRGAEFSKLLLAH